MYEHFNESPENLVEIELCVNNLCFPMPVRGRGGLLDFEESDHYDFTLNIRVPKEVAEDPELLRKYYRQQFYDHDILEVPTLNVWDKEKNDYKFSS